MAMSPQYKIYNDGEYIGSAKYSEHAAQFCACLPYGEIKHDHKVTIWSTAIDNPNYDVAHDKAAEMMDKRMEVHYAAYRRRQQGR